MKILAFILKAILGEQSLELAKILAGIQDHKTEEIVTFIRMRVAVKIDGRNKRALKKNLDIAYAHALEIVKKHKNQRSINQKCFGDNGVVAWHRAMWFLYDSGTMSVNSKGKIAVCNDYESKARAYYDSCLLLIELSEIPQCMKERVDECWRIISPK